tara:strand:+ start:486 stop:752 length:267 start_codon:yes stop_codon:yes gene_type:complete
LQNVFSKKDEGKLAWFFQENDDGFINCFPVVILDVHETQPIAHVLHDGSVIKWVPWKDLELIEDWNRDAKYQERKFSKLHRPNREDIF